MTISTILLIGASESVQKMVKWVISEHFSILTEDDFSDVIFSNGTEISLIILAKTHSTDQIQKLQDQNIPILLLIHHDEIDIYTDTLKEEKTDYLLQPFYPQDLLARVKKNILPPTPQTIVALFDPSELISQETRRKWHQRGMAIHAFTQDKPLLAFIKTKHTDIVISDASLPTHNAEILLETVKNKDIPLFSLFPVHSDQMENNSLYHQSNDYSVAPFDADATLLRIKRILKKKIPPSLLLKTQKKPNINGNNGHPQNGNTPALMSQVNVTLNHEIRSPLTSILICAQVLKKHSDENSQEYQIAKEIEEASRRIQTTLDDFGQLKQVVLDDYINGIKMLNLKRSGQSESGGNGSC
jgi:DNA-binding response OmpR family regulator